MERRFELVVAPNVIRMRLEDYLLDKFATVSKMYLRELVKTERCEVNGRCENIGYRLRANDVVEIVIDDARGRSMLDEDLEIEVLFEDDELIVVNKPAGMLVHPSHRENSGTLLNGLVFHFNSRRVAPRPAGTGRIRPGLIHRLDRETSGLLVVAKTARAHRIVSGHFMKKRVEKRYAALVEGVVQDQEGVIHAPIGRFAELKQWGLKPDGKDAQTRFWVRERRADTTFIELEPVTGRTNQLRIHCEAIGHPIVGDTKRGGREAVRLYLHSEKLSFPHPVTSEKMTFESLARFPDLT